MGEPEELLRKLNDRYGSSYQPEGRLLLRKEKLFLYTGEGTRLPYDWLGLHIANIDLSLTIEGAQLLGPTAAKNTITITKQQADRYYRGQDIPGIQGEGHVILKTPERTIGAGRLQNGTLKNTLPESRKTKL